MPVRYMDPCNNVDTLTANFALGSANGMVVDDLPGYDGVTDGYYRRSTASSTANRSARTTTLLGIADPTSSEYRSYSFAFKTTSTNDNADWLPGFSEGADWSDISTTYIDFGMYLSAGNSLFVRYSATDSVDTGYVLPLDTWVHIAAYCKYSSSADWAVAVDGTVVASSAMHGVGNPTGEKWYYFHVNPGYHERTFELDDLVIGDDNFLYPPAKVREFVPTSAPTGQWTGSDADSTDNHLLVADNDDLTYVGASASGDTDLYGFTPGLVNDPLAMQAKWRCSYEGEVGPAITGVVSSGGTEAAGKSIVPSATPVWYSGDVLSTDPNTGAAWTAAAANAVQVGVRVP